MSENGSTDQPHNSDLHKATTVRASRLSPIWIIPVVAALIGAWLVVDNYLHTGPLITLTISNAEGIEAGKTRIKTRNVDIGQVEEVKLSDDLSQALVMARINHDAEEVLVEDTRFWVVKPRISREGISGFGTVLSGAYIQLHPGQSQKQRRKFEVLEQPPVALDGNEGIRIKLVSQLGNSLRVGDPVTYQGYTVGRVESAEFDEAALQVNHQLFIEQPYDALINANTRFWSAKGVNLELSSTGFEVNIASLEALLSGGVTFGILEDLPAGPVEQEQVFQLFPDEEKARQGLFSDSLEYVLLVEDTVRGLSEGAPVEFRGLRVGTVKEVPWRFTSPERRIRENFAIPVLISIEPQRLGGQEKVDLASWRERLKNIVENGLHATLKSGNLLTGALFVDLNFQRDQDENRKLETFEKRLVIPTTPTGLAQIELKVSSLLDKLNALQIEPIMKGMDNNMQQSESLLREVRSLTASVKDLLDNPEIQQVPTNINQTLTELRKAIEGLSPESQTYQELNQTLQTLETLLRDLQPLARTLGEQPNALIFNPPATNDPQPPAATP
ncbi:intermembrane transport protein PqiB [Methylophaga sp. OBS1]|uniref:intermembrane transport protein PqiB n=1 Tax=Methylophaga sp. OBS1 TaxID=2991933 RepID=UPI00224DA1AA|nr:intermembrane transport protein PqiB [Methylophaga sp. OBS1]MCX4191248.1 intermembrane transport protein PqiB [Methylophaga sp. OBS1]MCX4191806.1 intermembrane transport protein PqiB [Methylophaga sp. OBS1]